MRELGLVTTFWDVNFSRVQTAFANDGMLADELYIERIDKFLNELTWMAKTLRYGREQIARTMNSNAMVCPDCGDEMNHHSNKIVYGAGAAHPGSSTSSAPEIIQESHTCPKCGANASRASTA